MLSLRAFPPLEFLSDPPVPLIYVWGLSDGLIRWIRPWALGVLSVGAVVWKCSFLCYVGSEAGLGDRLRVSLEVVLEAAGIQGTGDGSYGTGEGARMHPWKAFTLVGPVGDAPTRS